MLDNKQSYLDNVNEKNIVNKDIKIYEFKVILLGDIAVGKTSIFNRFIKDEFNLDYEVSIGVQFNIKNIMIDESTKVNLKIWDTCGEEKYRSITKQYFSNSDAVILIFDLTRSITFNELDLWINDVKDINSKGIIIFLVGNKKDLVDSREVTTEMVNNYLLNNIDVKYFETSALTGENVMNVFDNLSKILIQKYKDRVNLCNDSDINDKTILSETKIEDKYPLKDSNKTCC